MKVNDLIDRVSKAMSDSDLKKAKRRELLKDASKRLKKQEKALTKKLADTKADKEQKRLKAKIKVIHQHRKKAVKARRKLKD